MGSPERPVIGTLASGRVNGMAVKPPKSTTYLILLEDGLFLFCHLMGKALAQGVPLSRPPEGGYSYSLEPAGLSIGPGSDAFSRMVECFKAYLIDGDVARAPRYLASTSTNALAKVWREGAELFVVGHEWAHVHRGHLEGGKFTEAEIPEADVQMIVTRHTQEFEADYFGAAVAIQAHMVQGLDLALSYLGPRSFLAWLEVLEDLLSILRHGEVQERRLSPTHPPTPKRRQSLDQALRASLARSVHKDQIDSAIAATDAVDTLFLECAKHLRDEFKLLHGQGVRPHAIWGP